MIQKGFQNIKKDKISLHYTDNLLKYQKIIYEAFNLIMKLFLIWLIFF
jgi:hypothetical protein